MKKLTLSGLVLAMALTTVAPAAAADENIISLTEARLNQMTEAAEHACAGPLNSKRDPVSWFTEYFALTDYSQDERKVMISLCALYLKGRIAGNKVQLAR